MWALFVAGVVMGALTMVNHLLAEQAKEKGMLIRPSEIQAIPGTHVLGTDLGLVGTTFEDPKRTGRSWTIEAVFTPFSWRALGGVRAKLRDNKEVISFVNQRDLELLLELASPGDWIPWMDGIYPGVNDEDDGWYGICADDEDLIDDLHYHELMLRQQFAEYGFIPEHQQYMRRVQREEGSLYEENLLFLWDKDVETGYGPDGRRETIQQRWSSVDQTRIEWNRIY